MNKPTDYPIDAEQTDTIKDDTTSNITYAALKDRVEAKQLVTDEMIRIARAKLDAAHIDTTDADTDQSKFKLGKIRDRFRAE